MNRKLKVFTMAAFLAAVPLVQPARAQVDIHIGIPLPPLPRVVFETEPEVVVIPNTDVYNPPRNNDYGTYRVGPFWYINRDGYWYRARGYRGEFRPVPYNRVPRQIVVVPGEFRRHPIRPLRRGPVGRPGGHREYREQHNDSRHRGKHHQHD